MIISKLLALLYPSELDEEKESLLRLVTSALFALACVLNMSFSAHADGRCVCTSGANAGYRPYCVPSASACEFECSQNNFLSPPPRLCNSNGIEARSHSEPGHHSEPPSHRSRASQNHLKQHTVRQTERGRHPAVV